MIICKECGYTYNETMRNCPECGSPTEMTLGASAKNCPNCGAELHNTQGYNFVCEFCGTVSPVDSQTRAMLDAQRNEVIRQQARENDEKMKKGCTKAAIIVFIVIFVFYVLIWVISFCSYRSYSY